MTRPHICTRGLKRLFRAWEIGMKYHPKWPDRIYAQGDWNSTPKTCLKDGFLSLNDPTAYMHKGIETSHLCLPLLLCLVEPNMTRPHICTRGLKQFSIKTMEEPFSCRSSWLDRIYAQGDWNVLLPSWFHSWNQISIWPDRIYAQGDWNPWDNEKWKINNEWFDCNAENGMNLL